MEWKLDKERPVCPQICEQLCVHIANGAFAPQERLPSVREVAIAAGVNPNTVQHAFETLEQKGLLYSVRGSGWFVGEDISLAKDAVKGLMHTKTAAYFAAMAALGMDAAAVKTYVKEWEHE